MQLIGIKKFDDTRGSSMNSRIVGPDGTSIDFTTDDKHIRFTENISAAKSTVDNNIFRQRDRCDWDSELIEKIVNIFPIRIKVE